MRKLLKSLLLQPIPHFSYALLGIAILAMLLRFVHLGSNPPALSWDEVAWGYNAYSLGIDGRDEFGRFLPFDYLESYGDFKPPLYAYAGILPVKLFGLTEFASRFPSAFFGVLSVIMTFFLVKELFRKNVYREWYGLAAALFLAISPWHINLSRAAFEANVAQFFIISGVWLFLRGIQAKPWSLLISAGMFALSFYTFNTSRIVSPVIVAILIIISWKELWRYKKQSLLAGVFGALLVLPLIPFLLSPQAGLRFKEVNIFSDITVVQRANQEIANDHNSIISKVIHNRRIAYGVEYIKHYLDNFNPAFLFIRGDENRRFSTQDVGEMYLWDLPFLLVGIYWLFKNKEGKWWVLPVWILSGIIPAATARETPHALRIETILPTLQILTACGVINAFLFVNKYYVSRLKYQVVLAYALTTCYILLATFAFLYYLSGYYVHYPREFSSEWQYGYKQSVQYAKSIEEKYDRIYVTNALGRPYMYFLFYQHITPDSFRETAAITRDSFGFVHVNSVGKYTFTDDLNDINQQTRNLFIMPTSSVPQGAHMLKTFVTPNGTPVFTAYTL